MNFDQLILTKNYSPISSIGGSKKRKFSRKLRSRKNKRSNKSRTRRRYR